jgi:hypothetical protein
LSHPEKDALIAALTARLVLADKRIAAQDARIAALEARLNELSRPPKTPGNSSKPPSQGQKQDLPDPATDRPPRKGRLGVGRTLHPHPDRTIDRLLRTCPKCEAVLPDALQTPQQVYERIELPPVRPASRQVDLETSSMRQMLCSPTREEPERPPWHTRWALPPLSGLPEDRMVKLSPLNSWVQSCPRSGASAWFWPSLSAG